MNTLSSSDLMQQQFSVTHDLLLFHQKHPLSSKILLSYADPVFAIESIIRTSTDV